MPSAFSPVKQEDLQTERKQEEEEKMACFLFPGKWNPVLIPSGYESKEKKDEFQSKLLFVCLRLSEGLSTTRSFREKTAYHGSSPRLLFPGKWILFLLFRYVSRTCLLVQGTEVCIHQLFDLEILSNKAK